MDLHQFSIALLLFCTLMITLATGINDPTHFAGDISINCGSTGPSASLSGKKWLGDVLPKSSSWLQIIGSSTISTVIHELNSADPIPQKTARISRSQFSYAFQLNSGQKIIRLQFNPTPYKGFQGFKDLFSVDAGPFTLLSNFSASLTAAALGVSSLTKEFCLNVQENQQLNITFSPASSPLGDNAYAFINGIEIISIPAHLSYIHEEEIGVQVVGQNSLVYVDHSIALEIVHQRNIISNPVPSSGGSGEILPMWAILESNKIRNNTWKMPVDVGFRYLIRIHFSELGLKIITGSGDLIFKILINKMIAQTNIDIVKQRSNNNNHWYSDYMVMMQGQKKEGKRDILISLESYDGLVDAHGLLTGFEILKLSNPDYSLTSPNPLPPRKNPPSLRIRTLLLHIGNRNAIATVAVIVISLVNLIVHKVREIWESSRTDEKNKPSARAKRICRRFSFAEIQLSTRNFSEALVIGRGGFGKVYEGLVDNGQETVAIKRQKFTSSQGAHEFLTEIEMLSELRHVNLVSLIGYCNDHGEMILVYEYMACGTLADHLYKLERGKDSCSSLSWKLRLNICIGAARGLDYLHTGHGVIHRDVKSSNILLDENFVAKVADFGLAKPEDRKKLQSHVSTKVKGTPGYFDPFYLSTSRLTRKSDTYAFGVLLLEVLCGRPAVDSKLEEERILSKWALNKIIKGEVDEILATSLRDEISADSLETFVAVAERCLSDEPKNRPTMSQVVLQLEYALVQQENGKFAVPNVITRVADDACPSHEEITSPASAEAASTGLQTFTLPPTEKSNKKMDNTDLPAVKKDGRKLKIQKPSRLWPWDAFWNRVKSSKEKGFISVSVICEADTKLPKFDLATIAAATNQFSHNIGVGGFTSVYKAVLPTGQIVAVKRFSSSRRACDQFKNEISLAANLHHENIIKLVGYCIAEGGMLLYEFMENGRLDTLLFDEEQHRQLQWSLRFKVIIAVAKGIIYLHQNSGFSIIHRDIKLSNILLDIDMNPRISDFGLAKILPECQSESETLNVCGTIGYLAPECLGRGKYSVKSDVYSFGVTVLEIVCGRKWRTHQEQILPNHAWELWNEGRTLDLVDKSLLGAFPMEEVLRCIRVGLLCTQQEPHNRPEMPRVLKMLEVDELQSEPQRPWMLPKKYGSECSSLHTEIGKADIRLPKFDLATIAAATNQFSQKIEEGGSGSVYKAVLPTGQIVAAKRFSSTRLTFNQFKSEIHLVTSLHHENIIKLVGCCIDEGWMLLYEFMGNGRLDTFVFDEVQRHLLQWPLRFKIITGVARGIIYLHHDSGLRIIHRHLKPSNILLDNAMNPKISGFGLAKIFEEDQSEAENRVAGDLGTSPEYAIEGRLSDKVDVYSFGVLVLEVLSGKKNTGYSRNGPEKLIESAWEQWDAGNPWNFADEFLRLDVAHGEILRCIQVGLLCTQPGRNHRPTMASVLKMLLGEDSWLDEKMEDCRRGSGAFQEDQHDSTASLASGDSAATFEYDDTMQLQR